MMSFNGENGIPQGVRHKSLNTTSSVASSTSSPQAAAELFLGDLKPTSIKVGWYELHPGESLRRR